jgi:hypothetical protein
LNKLRRRSAELGQDEWMTFTGRADKSMIADHLSGADISFHAISRLLLMIFRP